MQAPRLECHPLTNVSLGIWSPRKSSLKYLLSIPDKKQFVILVVQQPNLQVGHTCVRRQWMVPA